MRKKPDGSAPYKETWYLFGNEILPGVTPEKVIIDDVKNKSGIDITVTERISWGEEIKNDLDGVEKQFIYLRTICEYLSGELILTEGIEKIEWVPIAELKNYDIVPPSRVLFNELGYLN